MMSDFTTTCRAPSSD